jgi:hypothetical protein
MAITVVFQKFGCRHNQRPIEGLERLHITPTLEMAPQGPEDQGGLVFLDRQLLLAVAVPGVPRAAERAVRVVLMQEVTLVRDDAPAEVEEAAAQLPIPGEVEGRCGERAVAGPHVAVGIAPEL